MDAIDLEPGERILAHVDGIRATLAKSPPALRGSVGIPLVQEISLSVTSRRVVVRAELFLGLFDADFCAWYEADAEGKREVLRGAALREDGVLGPSLELHTERERPGRLRSRSLALRLWGADLREAFATLPEGLRRGTEPAASAEE